MGWEEMTAGVQRVCVNTFHAREPVVYRPGGLAPSFTIRGIFRDEHAAVELGEEGAVVSSVHPTLGVILSDFPSPPMVDDEIDIPATPAHPAGSYQVKDRQPDGEGMAELILQRLP